MNNISFGQTISVVQAKLKKRGRFKLYLSNKFLQQLLKRDSEGIKLSIYIPTNPKSNAQSIAQDTTRLKNAIKDIRNNPDYKEREIGESIKSLEKLLDDVEFWQHQDKGLAVFIDKDGYEYCHLPYEITEATYLGEEFVISPLVIMKSIGTGFYVLDVNASKPRLLKSDQGTLVEIGKEEMPGSFQEDGARDEYKPELQHMGAPRGSGGDNKFHGHGVDKALDHDMERYLVLIAEAVDKILSDQDLPLVIAGEQSRVGNLRPHLKYKNTIAESIDGNFEDHTPQELYVLAIKVIQDYDSQNRHVLIDELKSSGPDLVVKGSQEIAEAAKVGRVKRMYIPAYRRTTDSVQPGMSETVILQLPDDIHDLETTIRDVLSQAGEVYAVAIDAHLEIQEPKALCRF